MRWHIALLYFLIRSCGRLPLRVLHRLGAGLGWIFWVAHGKERRIAGRNLELAFPELDEAQHAALLQRTLAETGKSFLEVTKVWSGDAHAALGLIREVRGVEFYDAALAAKRGLIIAAPHLGCWELLNFYLCSRAPIAVAYRPPRQADLEPLLLKARGTLQAEQVRAEGAGVRTLYKRLSAGGVVGILPDQEPKQGDDEFAPFFGVRALTMVLVSRLAQRTGATVLFSFAERLPQGAGYRLHFVPAPAAIADEDLNAAAVALNQGVESCVRIAPAQYQWHYKRFSARPPDDPQRLY